MRFLLLISFLTYHVTNFNVLGLAKTRQDALKLVTRSANAFAPNFLEAAADNVNGSFICSPISASMLLSMIAYGARGNTEAQLRAALRLSKDNDVLAERGFQVLDNEINNYKKVDLILANKIYLAGSFEPKTKFTDFIKTAFHSEVESLNFGDPTEATNTINNWCEARTKNHIKKLFNSNDIKNDTALVLVSAVYFKGNWADPFDPAKTRHQTLFQVNNNTIKHVSMMSRFDNFTLGELPELKARFIELPYESEGFSDSVSMFVILPDQFDADLAKLEKNIKKLTVDKLLLRGRTRKVLVGLPRFQIKSEIPFKRALVQMGLTDMFTSAANFTGIADFPPLQVSKIVQKAFIEVNEQGSSAAAASGSISIPRTITPEGPQIFEASHPFITIIATKGENPVNLFISRYTGPR